MELLGWLEMPIDGWAEICLTPCIWDQHPQLCPRQPHRNATEEEINDSVPLPMRVHVDS